MTLPNRKKTSPPSAAQIFWPVLGLVLTLAAGAPVKAAADSRAAEAGRGEPTGLTWRYPAAVLYPPTADKKPARASKATVKEDFAPAYLPADKKASKAKGGEDFAPAYPPADKKASKAKGGEDLAPAYPPADKKVSKGKGGEDFAPAYLPADKKVSKGGLIRLAAVGDLMLGQVSPDNHEIFAEVKPFLADRQIVFGNLEGPLTDQGSPTKDPSAGAYHLFRSPPASGRVLKEAGFNLLSLANNHINDYGPAGRAQTVSVLKGLGLHHAGGPGEVARLKVNKTRLAFIALAPNVGCQDLNDLDGAVALVKAEKAKSGTLVIVSFHGGGEGSAFMRRVNPQAEYYLGENRGNLPLLAQALIDAGADLVLGHGPHVPRGLKLYRGRLIAWSLGNFATLSGMGIQGVTGLAPLLLVDLAPNGALKRVKVVGFKQEPGRGPRLDPENKAARVMAELSRGDLPEEWLTVLGDAGIYQVKTATAKK